MSVEKQYAIMSHELGHILQRLKFDKLSDSDKTEIIEAHKEWYSKTSGKTIQEVENESRDLSSSPQYEKGFGSKPFNDKTEYGEYLVSFKEWFADGVSKYITSADKPKSVLEKFFQEIISYNPEYGYIGRYWEKGNLNEIDIAAINVSILTF
jgi:hypothetical protein